MNSKVYWILFLVAIVIAIVIRYKYVSPDVSNEEIAPDFEYVDLDGNGHKLSDNKGSWILLDFWGSWCGPCRAETSDVVSLYDNLKNEKFRIVSIGIESSESRWKSAIKQDGMEWKDHFCDFQMFESPIAKLYGIRSIPAKILINPEGKIQEVNPSFEQIKSLVRGK